MKYLIWIRHAIVSFFAFLILFLGLLLLVLPGPGLLFVFLGLTLLATEFVWARKVLHNLKHVGKEIKKKLKSTGKK